MAKYSASLQTGKETWTFVSGDDLDIIIDTLVTAYTYSKLQNSSEPVFIKGVDDETVKKIKKIANKILKRKGRD